MFPYYSYPFEYGNRLGHGTPQIPTAVSPITQTAPMAPVSQPSAPVQPVTQPQMPAQTFPNMPPMMPVCPFTGNPVMPMAVSPLGYYGNQGMPTAPLGPIGNQGLPMLTPGIANIPEMEDLNTDADMEMDFAPATTSDRDPQPVLSNNPADTRIVLFKELTGYPNYGNPSGNADILYTGNRGAWTFDVPAFLFVPGNLTARIVIRGVLDDHANVPVSRYSARITINGSSVHNGPVPLVHGIPAGGRFTNWRELTFTIPNFRRSNRIVIVNTSTTGADDWIGLDWMELRLLPR